MFDCCNSTAQAYNKNNDELQNSNLNFGVEYSRRIWLQSPFSATVAEFGDYSRQCGQDFRRFRITDFGQISLLTGSCMPNMFVCVNGLCFDVQAIVP